MHMDSQPAINFRQNTGKPSKMKHIDMRHTWLRENDEEIRSIKIDTDCNGADIFTKLPTRAMTAYWYENFTGVFPRGGGSRNKGG